MPVYNAPGVYIHDQVSGFQTIEQTSAYVGALIGVTRSGLIGEAQKVTSWTEFIEKYANGLDTPFLENSYLPYSAYGFFQNGGKELYIGRVAKNAVKASVESTAVNGISATADSEGVWGNSLKVSIKKSADYDEEEGNLIFDVKISLGTSDYLTLFEVTLETIADRVVKEVFWISEFSVDAGTSELAEEEFVFENGSDGDTLNDNDYINALNMLDLLDDLTLVGVPGQTSRVMNAAIMDYCEMHELFPIIDVPMGSTPDFVKNYRKSFSTWTGALPYPWGKVNDPLNSDSGKLKLVPTCGHYMGLYARIINERGVHKAPAGTEANIRGFIELETSLTQANIEALNPVGVICIVAKPNAGIIVWGARSLNSTDTTMRYVSDGLLNLNIKRSLYYGTQFAVFEPNNEVLWKRVETSCKAFLEYLRTQGALMGTAEEAYYVTVDKSNNTPYTISAGQLNITIGYAPVKPAEFVIIKLYHSIENNT